MSIFEGLRNESLFNKAYNLIQQGKYHEAIGYYDKILEANFHHVKALYGKGLVFQRLELYNDSLEF
ncbi:MAG: tetratricopeptide repeat protein [Methanobacterium formicicum]